MTLRHWYYHPTTNGKLHAECGGNVRRSGCDKYGVIGSSSGESQSAIARDHMYVRVTALKKKDLCAAGESGNPFQGPDLSHKQGEDGRLVTGAGPDLKDA